MLLFHFRYLCDVMSIFPLQTGVYSVHSIGSSAVCGDRVDHNTLLHPATSMRPWTAETMQDT